MGKKSIIDNPVENYFRLEENKMKNLSVKTLSKRFDMRKKDVYFYLFNSKNLQRVNPMVVGSLASNTRVFRFTG